MDKRLLVTLICAGTAFGGAAVASPVIYEPFDYTAGQLNGSGASELGLEGTWAANSTTTVIADTLGYGVLPVTGASIGDLDRSLNRFGGSRAVSSAALSDNGLLDHGSTLWFSILTGLGTGGNIVNARVGFALANNTMNTANYNYSIMDEDTQLGSGIGVSIGKVDTTSSGVGKVCATEFKDPSYGNGIKSNVFGDLLGSAYAAGEYGLVVGKITWGATADDLDTIEIYQPDLELNLGTVVSTLETMVDQSTFDTITFARGDVIMLDEIRFGASFESVMGTDDEDLSAPYPNPMSWAIAPRPVSENSILMAVNEASDQNGVEYYFTCVAGGGHDSGWQDSPTYTDVGLLLDTTYSYTAMARDKSPNANQTEASSEVQATTLGGVIAEEIVIYEPFDYEIGYLTGAAGSNEVGLVDTWVANTLTRVTTNTLSYGTLPVTGRSMGDLTGGLNRFGGSRAISASALGGKGLLSDGASLWFSVLLGHGTGGNINNARLGFALSSGSFSTSNYQFWIEDEEEILGAGIGVTLGNAGEILATKFSDEASGSQITGNVLGNFSGTSYGEGEFGLIVGKITWGASIDRIELYQPDAEMNMGTAISTLETTVDQSTFDTLTFTRGDVVVMDEIRFATTYETAIGIVPRGPTVIGEVSCEMVSGSMKFSWYAMEGTSYSLVGTDDLSIGTWSPVTNVIGADGMISVLHGVDGSDKYFYKVKSPAE